MRAPHYISNDVVASKDRGQGCFNTFFVNKQMRVESAWFATSITARLGLSEVIEYTKNVRAHNIHTLTKHLGINMQVAVPRVVDDVLHDMWFQSCLSPQRAAVTVRISTPKYCSGENPSSPVYSIDRGPAQVIYHIDIAGTIQVTKKSRAWWHHRFPHNDYIDITIRSGNRRGSIDQGIWWYHPKEDHHRSRDEVIVPLSSSLEQPVCIASDGDGNKTLVCTRPKQRHTPVYWIPMRYWHSLAG